MIKRIISGILTVIMLLTSVQSVFAQDTASPIVSTSPDDVPEISFSFNDPLPAEYADYFTNLLTNPSSDPACSIHGAYIAYIFGGYCILAESELKRAEPTRNFMPILAVCDSDSGKVLAMETFGWSTYYFETIFPNDLPDFFDEDKHVLKLFNFIIDYHPDSYYVPTPSYSTEYFVSTPQVIDLRDYIYGDADKNKVVNLTDITLMLKNIAKWNSVTVEMPNDGHEYYEEYSLSNVTFVLQMIAGWSKESLIGEPSFDSPCGFGMSAALKYTLTS